MKVNLKSQLILSYVLLTFIIIGIISFLVNITIRKGFESYTSEKHNQLVLELIDSIEHDFSTQESFDTQYLEHIGVEAIEKGLILSIYDTNNILVWSAMEHNSGLCESMMNNIRENMYTHYNQWNGNYTEDVFELNIANRNIGKITIGYLGPFYFNEEELYFLSSVNRILLLVSIGSMLVAILIGILISKSIITPIESVIHYLNHIQDTSTSSLPKHSYHSQEIQNLYISALTLEQRIHEQEKLRKQLTQDMAHEIKTPLTSIQGQLEAMIDGIFPLTTERIHSCYEEIIRIKSLIQEVEALSSIENDTVLLNFDYFNLHDLVLELSTTFQTSLLEQGMSIHIKYGSNYDAESYTNFYGDLDKMKQVFFNLTSNAIKYAGTGTKIVIQLDNDTKGNYMIHYLDNGPGVPEKDIPFIFERFYRADLSRSGHMGIGIGLTLAKTIISKHSGQISYQNTLNEGAHFLISLPSVTFFNSQQ